MNERSQIPIESRLMQTLLSDRFALTAEVVPPVSAGADDLFSEIDLLKDHVDAINLADSAGGRVHMSGLACAALMIAKGIEPVLQVTCRDRNRLALYSDLLGAGAIGVHNLLIMKGDNLNAAEMPNTKVVHDVDSAELIETATALTATGILRSRGLRFTSDGVATEEKQIKSPPTFFVGAADLPGATDTEWWRGSLRKKVQAGAQFIQTQLCFCKETITNYAQALRQDRLNDNLFVLIGTGPLKSARSAIWMRDNLYGATVPDTVIERLRNASDQRAEGISICAELLEHIAQTRGLSGAHLMAPGNVDAIPEVIARAGTNLQDLKMARA